MRVCRFVRFCGMTFGLSRPGAAACFMGWAFITMLTLLLALPLLMAIQVGAWLGRRKP